MEPECPGRPWHLQFSGREAGRGALHRERAPETRRGPQSLQGSTDHLRVGELPEAQERTVG